MTDESVVWLEEVGKEDIAIVGGKGASLGEMLRAELPVPPGFGVTAQAFKRFIDENGINDELFGSLEMNVDNADILRDVEKKAKQVIMGAKVKYREPCIREGKHSLLAAVQNSIKAYLPDASLIVEEGKYDIYT
jgi:pyruvate,water dikinase